MLQLERKNNKGKRVISKGEEQQNRVTGTYEGLEKKRKC